MKNIEKLTEAELMDMLVTYTTKFTQTRNDLGAYHKLYKLYITQILDELVKRESVIDTPPPAY